MKTIKIIAIVLSGSILTASCNKDDDDMPAATVYYQQQDQMGRPAVNTVFNATADKDGFNVTTPSAMGAIYQPKFLTNLVALDAFLFSKNPAYVQYTTNALTWSPTTLTTTLATDVLGVSTNSATSLGTLTGRTPGDDAIDIELKYLIFGGPDGMKNPQLTSDHVDANDKAFSASFPYLAAPF
jgi:hypothetical protein